MNILSAEDLTNLLNDATVFRGELSRWRDCEAAEDIRLPAEKQLDLRLRVVEAGFTWAPKEMSAGEIDLFFGMAREAARIRLARRTASFRAKYGIVLTCGDEPIPGEARSSDPIVVARI